MFIESDEKPQSPKSAISEQPGRGLHVRIIKFKGKSGGFSRAESNRYHVQIVNSDTLDVRNVTSNHDWGLGSMQDAECEAMQWAELLDCKVYKAEIKTINKTEVRYN